MTYTDLKEMKFDWNLQGSKSKVEQVLDMTYKTLKFYGLNNWSVTFDGAKQRAGYCSFLKKSISFSKYFVEMNGFDEIESTIKHEVAHAIAYVYFNHTEHGKIWKKVAIAIGDDGKRCYDSAQVIMPKGKYIFECTNCHIEAHYHKKSSSIKACGKCCNKYNHGKFSMDYVLKPKNSIIQLYH